MFGMGKSFCAVSVWALQAAVGEWAPLFEISQIGSDISVPSLSCCEWLPYVCAVDMPITCESFIFGSAEDCSILRYALVDKIRVVQLWAVELVIAVGGGELGMVACIWDGGDSHAKHSHDCVLMGVWSVEHGNL